MTGDHGILFDHMLVVQGEVPPRRFAGKYKDFGSQYNRAVEEGNGQHARARPCGTLTA